MNKAIFFLLFTVLTNISYSQWAQISTGIGNTAYIECSIKESNIMLAGTSSWGNSANGIYFSTNSGTTWTHSSLYTRKVFSLFHFSNSFYAGTDSGIYVSSDNGINWLQTSFNNKIVNSLLSTGNTFVAGCGNSSYTQGIYFSTDFGSSWAPSSLTNVSVHKLAATNNYVFAATQGNGVYYSTNNGANWLQTGLGSGDIYCVAADGSNIAASSGGDLLYSTNYGVSWTNLLSVNRQISPIALSQNSIFAGTIASGGISYGIYLSTNLGATWTQCNQGFGELPWATSLNISGDNLYAGSENISFWRRALNELMPPTLPVLVSPGNNAGNVPVNTNLIWNRSYLAGAYDVQLAADSNFTSYMINDTVFTDTCRPVLALSNFTKYWWRVRAKNTAGYSQYSAVFKFTTIALPPSGAPIQVSPPNNSINQILTPILDWDTVSESGTFRVQLSIDSTFITPIIDSAISVTQISIPPGRLNTNARYYWRVRAVNTGGEGPWSFIWNFLTIPLPPVNPPNLVSPPSNSLGQSLTPFMDWDTTMNSTSFRLQISSNSIFSSCEFDTTLNSTGTIVPSGKLIHDVVYYWRVCAVNPGGAGPWSAVWNFKTGLVDIRENGNEIPKVYKLYPNYPNPFNPSTILRFDLPSSSFVVISIFNITGQEIRQLVNRKLNAGKYTLKYDGSNLASGVYFYRMIAGDYTDIKKMVLLK